MEFVLVILIILLSGGAGFLVAKRKVQREIFDCNHFLFQGEKEDGKWVCGNLYILPEGTYIGSSFTDIHWTDGTLNDNFKVDPYSVCLIGVCKILDEGEDEQ